MKKKIGIIGCGNMGEAILKQSLRHKIQNIIFFDKLTEAFICKEYHVKAARDIVDLVDKSDILIIAVKPQDIDVVLEEIKRGIQIYKKRRILIISIAAGITTAYLEKKISGIVRVVRAMPNMPGVIGEGITALVKGQFASNGDLRSALEIFGAIGKTLVMKKEGLIDVVTALSGSGPAYIFFIIIAMLSAAEGLGLDKKAANQLIYYTVVGAMNLHKERKFDAKKLISQVASKGGTTEAALKIFRDRKLTNIISDAIMAAHKRAKELSKS